MRALLLPILAWCALAQPYLQTVTVPAPSLKGSRQAVVLLPRDYERSPARYPASRWAASVA